MVSSCWRWWTNYVCFFWNLGCIDPLKTTSVDTDVSGKSRSSFSAFRQTHLEFWTGFLVRHKFRTTLTLECFHWASRQQYLLESQDVRLQGEAGVSSLSERYKDCWWPKVLITEMADGIIQSVYLWSSRCPRFLRCLYWCVVCPSQQNKPSACDCPTGNSTSSPNASLHTQSAQIHNKMYEIKSVYFPLIFNSLDYKYKYCECCGICGAICMFPQKNKY